MRAVAYVGRVGGLAVALGIGTVIAGVATGQAWAAPADSSSAAASAPAKAAKPAAGPRAHPAKLTPTRSGVSPAAARPASERGPAIAAVQSLPIRLSGGDPGTPEESPVSWVVAAASRRQPGQAQSAPAPASTASLVVQSTATASAKAGNPFNNQTPMMHPAQTAEDATGVVTGSLNTVDPDSSTETYTVTSNPGHGSVVVNTDGTYTYTPVKAAAHTGITDTFTVKVSDASSGFHLHGLSGLLNLLTFGLLGSAGHTSTATVTVIVTPVASANVPPTGLANVGTPDAVTGTVTGAVIGSDADGDPLTYTGSTTTGKGSVTVAADGTFTYTPTAVARHAAAKLTAPATALTDSFAVTISDGYGGSVIVPVSVAISTTNQAPVASTPSVGAPNAATGVVAGALIGSDADGDPLTYGGSTTTGKGSVTVAADGTFTYTPTLAARQSAGALAAPVPPPRPTPSPSPSPTATAARSMCRSV